MARVVNFEGQSHSFPDDASDDEIRQALGGAQTQGGAAGILPGIAQEFNNPSHSLSLIGAAGGLYRGAKSLFNDASDLGAGKVDLSSPQGADKAVGVAASVLPMSPAATATGMVVKGARPAAAPSREALGAAADADYAAGRSSGLQIDPASTGALADKMHAELVGEGYDPLNHPAVFRAIDRLRTPEASTINDVDASRKMLGRVGEDFTQRGATGLATKHIDNYLDNIPAGDVVAGDADRTSQFFRNGRSNYAAARRSDELTGAVDRAERQADKSGTGANVDNTTRQRADAIINKGDFVNGGNRLYGYTPEEVSGLEGVVKGSPAGNALRWIGRAAPTGPITMGAEGGAVTGALAAGRPELAAGLTAVPAVGYAAKKASDILTRNRMGAVDEMTRSRSALGQAMPPQPGRSVLLNPNMSPVASMIAGLMARQNQPQ